MKSLKEALISKDKRNWATQSSPWKKYFNGKYYYLFIPEFPENVEPVLGEEFFENCKWKFWLLDLDELKRYVKVARFSVADHLYAIKIEEYEMFDFDDFIEEVNKWDYNDGEFNGWPMLPIEAIKKYVNR